MKKIYLIATVAALTLFSACEDFNEKNFPGYDEAAIPKNLVNYEYELASADYVKIAKAITAPINDSISAQKVKLKNAKTLADSTLIKAEIDRLNQRLTTDPVYVMGTQLEKNKYFIKDLDAQERIPSLIKEKYLYADANSSVMVTYNSVTAYDTTTVSGSNKYTLVDDDYNSMGTTSGTPGQFKNFSSSISPNYYLAIWLKKNYPYAMSGNVKLIRYKFYADGATNLVAGVYTFDGTNWIGHNNVNAKVAKFTFKNKTWKYINSDIMMDLTDGIGKFLTVNVVGDQVWAWDSYGYMKMTGYVSGAYLDNEDWLISPPMDFTERATPWLKFMHVGRYFGDSGTSNDKMKAAITVWASTKSDGTSINTADWTQLTIPEAGYPSGANWTLITSTPIDLKEFAGKNNVRIAFKYLSSAADNAAGTWEVKNVYVFEE